jgi:hypothetical protein
MFQPTPTPSLSKALEALGWSDLDRAAEALSETSWGVELAEEASAAYRTYLFQVLDPETDHFDAIGIEYRLDCKAEDLLADVKSVAVSAEIAEVFAAESNRGVWG